MENRSLKIFMACSLGAGIGALIALSLNQYLWWLGAIAGFIIGYLTYEYEKIPNAIRLAWNQTKIWKNSYNNWQPDLRWHGRQIRNALLHVICIINCFSIGIMISITLLKTNIHYQIITSEDVIICLWLLTNLSIIFPLIFFFNTKSAKTEDEMIAEIDQRNIVFNPFPSATWGVHIKRYAILNLKYNAVTILFYHFPVNFFRLIVKMIITTPTAIKVAYKFSINFILVIASDIRLLCGTCAAIGAAFGFFTGSVIIGALVGGVFGVLNYEIFSKRLFKTT